MIIILMGPPGAGKGTQAALLKHALGVQHISTGDILRAAIREGTSLGEIAAQRINQGLFVPDEVIIDLVLERIKQSDCVQGVILDGFPRTVEQAKSLDLALSNQDKRIYSVLLFDVPEEVSIKRILSRETCKNCQSAYNIDHLPSQEQGICDRCGGQLYRRHDDTEETIHRRLTVYREQTMPLIDYYQQAGLLVQIDGTGLVEDITRRLLTALGQ